MPDYRIAVLPGDGIGPEVTREAVHVLQTVAEKVPGLGLEFREESVGAEEYLRGGDPLPEPAFESCRAADAVLLGAMGLPEVRWPDGKEMTPQVDLREKLDLYCGLRPIYLFHTDDSPLKGYGPGEIDFVLVRENTEGLFSDRHSRRDRRAEEVRDVMRISRKASQRIFRAAFQQAMQRRRKVTLVDKANVLPSMVFFREIFEGVAQEFPEVETECIYVDAASLYLVQRPQSFDVLVTENMFGDILSDLAAGLVGGMGMAPSADLGERCAVFQPSHGTAPDIAGQNKANPVATILSAAMLLEWLGDDDAKRGSEMIRAAVRQVMQKPDHRTADMGGDLSTAGMGELVRKHLA